MISGQDKVHDAAFQIAKLLMFVAIHVSLSIRRTGRTRRKGAGGTEEEQSKNRVSRHSGGIRPWQRRVRKEEDCHCDWGAKEQRSFLTVMYAASFICYTSSCALIPQIRLCYDGEGRRSGSRWAFCPREGRQQLVLQPLSYAQQRRYFCGFRRLAKQRRTTISCVQDQFCEMSWR